jgi:hypothetical protein
MLSLLTARALKQAGLAWKPAEFDFFSIPDRGLDERVFVISSMPAAIGQIQGQPMVTFEGAVEWALDYVATGEVVWLPTEEQLRGLLAARLAAEPRFVLNLSVTPAGCRCAITFDGQALSFEASDTSEAYAAALLHVLHQEGGSWRRQARPSTIQ